MSGANAVGRQRERRKYDLGRNHAPVPTAKLANWQCLDVNTETGYKFTESGRECGTAPLGPPGGPISNAPSGMRATVGSIAAAEAELAAMVPGLMCTRTQPVVCAHKGYPLTAVTRRAATSDEAVEVAAVEFKAESRS